MYTSIFIIIFSQITISYSYKTAPTPWFCTDPNAFDSTAVEISRKLPACLPGYAVDIEDVVYESTTDGTCSGNTKCSAHYKSALSFACNNKQICDIDTRNFRFHINESCGSTVRFFTKYHCLPVIQERKDYMCESTVRRSTLADINLSCEKYYRLHIKMALVGISVKPQDDTLRERFRCNQNTYWLCNQYVSDAYRSVCVNQLNRGSGDQCRIRSSERPKLKGCRQGEASNFSLVEYLCVPGDGIIEDLPRIDICSDKISDHISINRGLLQSPDYPQPLRAYVSCMKRLYISRDSRLRLFMLEKSLEYFNELNIRMLYNEPNIQRTLAKNELLDTNITSQQSDETVEIELKTKHAGGGNFLLYFQVDSRVSENAPLVFETDRVLDDNANRREKILIKRDWGIVVGSLVGLALVLILIAAVLLAIRISKHRRAKSLKYMNNHDDAIEQLNAPSAVNDQHRPTRAIQIEHPHLLSSGPKIISSSSRDIENTSDCESLLKHPSPSNPIRNKPYHEPTTYEDDKASPLNRGHHENEQNRRRPAPMATPEQDRLRVGNFMCDAPMASTETLDVGFRDRIKRPQQSPLTIPPPRMDLNHPQPSAPPLHLLYNNPNENTRAPHIQQQNNKSHTYM